MNDQMLGTFEYFVLRSVFDLKDGAYGVPIRHHIAEATKKEPSAGALYSTLARLETKGYVKSQMGEATAVRGGRSKKMYVVEGKGRRALYNYEAAVGSLMDQSIEAGV